MYVIFSFLGNRLVLSVICVIFANKYLNVQENRMSYISGHFRKGYFRNGRWVSGGYVKGHYRSGLTHASSYYSNTTVNKTASKTSIIENSSSEEEYLNERWKYWRRVVEEEGKAPKIETKTQKVGNNQELSNNTILAIVICVFLFVLFIIFLIAMKPGDEVINWFIAILLILAFLKR